MAAPKQKSWMITGVGSGLGRALACAALARGDSVAGTVRKAEDKTAFEALAPRRAPGRALGYILDVTDDAAVERVVGEIEQATGGLDILVNNAGYCLVGAIEEVSLAEIRAQFDVNVFGAVAVLKAVLPHMRRRRAGHIINITSVSGLVTWEGTGAYCASKFALEAFGQTLASETAGLGIRVTNVEPGGLRTPFNSRGLTQAKRVIEDYDSTAHASRRIIAAHAGQEPGDPDKAAQAILALADHENPPLNLLLGSDAKFYLARRAEQFRADLSKWDAATLGIGTDPEGS